MQFGVRPQLTRKAPPTPVVPFHRVYGRAEERRRLQAKERLDLRLKRSSRMKHRALKERRDKMDAATKPLPQHILDALQEIQPPVKKIVAAEAFISDARPRMRDILKDVAKRHGFNKRDLIGARQTRDVCAARQEFCYLARTQADKSYPQIGRFLGNRDHTTIIHAVRQHAKRWGLPL